MWSEKNMRQSNDAEAELLLLAAVLARAARDVELFSRGNSPEDQKIASEAMEWIFRPLTTDDGITSFQGICHALNLDHQWVHHRIMRMIPEEARVPFTLKLHELTRMQPGAR